MTFKVSVVSKNWPLHKPFKISRDVHLHSETIICEISDGALTGRGEAAGVSYAGETQESIKKQIEDVALEIAAGISREDLQILLPPGGARNAVDCAMWDLEAKRAGQTIWQMLGWDPSPVTTVYTVGIDEVTNMQKDAANHSDYPIIKVKVGIGDPLQQIVAIRAGAPNSAIVIDANQAWTVADLDRYAEPLKKLGVEMIEQPMSKSADDALRGYDSPLPLCADESCATTADLDRLEGLYSMVNIKLDKTGGLTEALKLAKKAEAMGFELMVGNMLGSSLAMAPSFVIAQRCRYVDIDGPLLQSEDCENAMHYEHGRVEVFTPALWG
ncbi:MAG: dipeptide epimerase [Proteobacteria bacterium]|nr:dipeptide epimerase [Pseudomonadota bacterium]MDA0994361.1 dipeptide epimerase [Pseudomonadota bacterium]